MNLQQHIDSYLSSYPQLQRYLLNTLFSIRSVALSIIFQSYDLIEFFKTNKTAYYTKEQTNIRIAQILLSNLFGTLKFFSTMLPLKDLLRYKFLKYFQQMPLQKDKSIKRQDDKIHRIRLRDYFLVNWLSPFLINMTKLILSYQFQHKIRLVNVQIYKQHVKKQNKGKFQTNKQILKYKYNGFISYLLGFAVFNTLRFAIFDTYQIYNKYPTYIEVEAQSNSVNNSTTRWIAKNMLVGSLSYYLNQALSHPFIMISLKKGSMNNLRIKSQYQLKSYSQAIREFRQKPFIEKIGLKYNQGRHFIQGIKFSFILTMYQRMKIKNDYSFYSKQFY